MHEGLPAQPGIPAHGAFGFPQLRHTGWLQVGGGSEAVTLSALLRKESRGAHSRLDFPNLDAQFGKVNHCVSLKNAQLDVRPTPLPEMPEELKALIEPAKELVK